MSYLNLAISRTAYNDPAATANPQESLFDYKTTRSGIPVSNPAGYTRVVYPGQTVLLDTTSRTLAYDGTTQFEISFPVTGSETVRMRWTGVGTAPNFRTFRNTGCGADTVVDILKPSPTSLTVKYVSGTLMNTATVQIGDDIYFQTDDDDDFTSPFNVPIQGINYKVTDKGADYITFRDNGSGSAVSNVTLGVDYASAFRVFSNDGVQIGDRMSFASNANLKYDNKAYIQTVSAVTDREVRYISPLAIPETAIPGLNTMNIFSRILSFIAIYASGPINLRFDNSVDTIKLYEYEPGQAMFIGTIQASSVYAVNETDMPATVVIHTCSL
jgi:hypothetical protein